MSKVCALIEVLSDHDEYSEAGDSMPAVRAPLLSVQPSRKTALEFEGTQKVDVYVQWL